jgi:hypothetical protein
MRDFTLAELTAKLTAAVRDGDVSLRQNEQGFIRLANSADEDRIEAPCPLTALFGDHNEDWLNGTRAERIIAAAADGEQCWRMPRYGLNGDVTTEQHHRETRAVLEELVAVSDEPSSVNVWRTGTETIP